MNCDIFVIVIHLKKIIMSNQDYKDREIEFSFDDVEREVYFEGCDEHTLLVLLGRGFFVLKKVSNKLGS